MDDQFEKLRELLKEQNYPSVYFYKFIIQNDEEKMVEVKKCFSETAEFSSRSSKNGKYLSISIKEMMLSTEDIIDRYKAVGQIKGVITL
ncbi:MAG: DUF493 domain-containing protein [Flavobacteriales bacterium]|nr:DUF493 domain-containing protein [Flavobacteriales bacterium]